MRSRRRRLLLLAVGGLGAVLLAFAAVPGTTAAQSGDPCEAVGNQTAVVVTPPTDAPTGPDGTVSVYRGSELVAHLCQPANGTRGLDAEGLTWATVVASGDEQLRIRVDGPTNDSIGTLAAPGSVPGPSLAIVDRSVETALVNGSIAVASAEQATALRTAEAAYLERERALESRLASLRAATATVENGSEASGTPIAETMAAQRAYRNASEQLRAELYAVADSPVGGPGSAAAIRALGERSSSLENRTRDRLRAHDAALLDRQESTTWSLRLRIVGLGLLGVVLGAAAGAILPIRRGRAARRRLAVGEWTTYSKRAVLLPAAIGLVLLCLGLGWLALSVGGAIAEVMLP